MQDDISIGGVTYSCSKVIAAEIERLRKLTDWADSKPESRGAQYRTLQDENGKLRELLMSALRYVQSHAEEEGNHPQSRANALGLGNHIRAVLE